MYTVLLQWERFKAPVACIQFLLRLSLSWQSLDCCCMAIWHSIPPHFKTSASFLVGRFEHLHDALQKPNLTEARFSRAVASAMAALHCERDRYPVQLMEGLQTALSDPNKSLSVRMENAREILRQFAPKDPGQGNDMSSIREKQARDTCCVQSCPPQVGIQRDAPEGSCSQQVRSPGRARSTGGWLEWATSAFSTASAAAGWSFEEALNAMNCMDIGASRVQGRRSSFEMEAKSGVFIPHLWCRRGVASAKCLVM